MKVKLNLVESLWAADGERRSLRGLVSERQLRHYAPQKQLLVVTVFAVTQTTRKRVLCLSVNTSGSVQKAERPWNTEASLRGSARMMYLLQRKERIDGVEDG